MWEAQSFAVGDSVNDDGSEFFYSYIKGAVMPQEIGPNQRKWIDALRSGEYAQGRRYLCDFQNRYCCLGVACRVFDVPEVRRDEDRVYFGKSFNYGAAPEEVVESLSLRTHLGDLATVYEIGRIKEMARLSQANDSGATFSEIADFCEQHPEAVFTEPR